MLLRQKMKVGPKGQVVIPKDIRKMEKIYPGTDVVFETTDHGIHIKRAEPDRDPIEVFKEIAEQIAKSGRNVKLDPHWAYEDQMEHRQKKRMEKK